MTTFDYAAPVVTGAAPATDPAHPAGRLVAKAVVDRVLAAGALIALAPALLLVALVVRATSRGPAIYRQVRYGHNGRPFHMWKFRTMCVGAELVAPAAHDADGLLYKVRNDPRVTAVGSFLRRWSLDEVPQLVNVLRGEMSLVGPRPLPVDPSRYDARARLRLLVKPGLTGLWQISGRSDLSWDHCVRLDLEYVHNWSIWLDVHILARTLAAVVRRAGAY